MNIFQKNILIVKPLRDALLGLLYFTYRRKKNRIHSTGTKLFVNHDIQPRPQAQKLFFVFWVGVS